MGFLGRSKGFGLCLIPEMVPSSGFLTESAEYVAIAEVEAGDPRKSILQVAHLRLFKGSANKMQNPPK